MIVVVDAELEEQAERFKLRFACPSCASFDPEGGGCSLGFPNADHLDPEVRGRREIVFCKTFELV